MLTQIKGLLLTITSWDIVDIIIVAAAIYQLYRMIRNTRAVALLKGVCVLLIATMVSNWLGLHVIYWLLKQVITMVIVATPIVFQPELRRALEQLGQGRLLRGELMLDREQAELLVEELVRAVMSLARDKTGALIVIERSVGLNDYIDTGVKINGLVSSELLLNIFISNTPLHDGAVIIRGNHIMAASCLLPLTESRGLGQELGTRHRAAIGLSEQSDALVLVVSEETGKVSIARGGHLQREFTAVNLEQYLQPLLVAKAKSINNLFSWRNKS